MMKGETDDCNHLYFVFHNNYIDIELDQGDSMSSMDISAYYERVMIEVVESLRNNTAEESPT